MTPTNWLLALLAGGAAILTATYWLEMYGEQAWAAISPVLAALAAWWSGRGPGGRGEHALSAGRIYVFDLIERPEAVTR